MNIFDAAVESRARQKKLYRISTVAHVLDTPPQTIRSWIHSGKLPAIKIGGNLYIKREAVDALVEHAAPVRRPQ